MGTKFPSLFCDWAEWAPDAQGQVLEKEPQVLSLRSSRTPKQGINGEKVSEIWAKHLHCQYRLNIFIKQ